MKYFAYLDDREQGPFTPEELIDAGVRPSTYIWCKGMDDWTRAEEVAQVCRIFRQHLSGIPASPPPPPLPAGETPEPVSDEPDLSDIPPMFRHAVRKSGITPGPSLEEEPDTSMRPGVSLAMAILAAILCFPPTGIVALVYTVKTRRTWEKAQSAPDDSMKQDSSGDREELRRQAHEYARLAKMWTGITISLGMILYAYIFSRGDI